jgi:hypothetical protein
VQAARTRSTNAVDDRETVVFSTHFQDCRRSGNLNVNVLGSFCYRG